MYVHKFPLSPRNKKSKGKPDNIYIIINMYIYIYIHVCMCLGTAMPALGEMPSTRVWTKKPESDRDDWGKMSS